MDNNWEGVHKISAERASPSELAQESNRNFLVTFLNMLRNDVTFFKSSSVKNMGVFFLKRVQLKLVPKQ